MMKPRRRRKDSDGDMDNSPKNEKKRKPVKRKPVKRKTGM